ncbi:Type VI secretion system secreted protein VgrG [Paraburkholderia sabiae]|uniref:type VI secretion system Vgr family protein n=1 Tax=Paraburkholderia sabiae TaxID=273251 RepID=UPI001CAE71D7|nr:type VI secretion system Vgr family protein [Paraburkholderia sabiae]CAG9218681.1 Type VI secretion system secreted protein VgrG [Paraburkholderia sabiae]
MSDILTKASVDVPSKSITGRQAYFLDVLGVANVSSLSVVSFEAIERIGEPYRITVTFTHPDELVRARFLGKDAIFSIVPTEASPRKFSGWITRFSKLKTTKDFISYELVVQAHLSRLEHVSTCRIYQHQTAPEIIEVILRRHGFQGHQFRFRLRRQYPQHAFRMQYRINDLAYVQMLMQKEGIWCRIAEDEHGDVIHFSDDIDHYVYQPRLDAPYRETAGLEAGVEAVCELATHAHSVAQGFTVADYNPEQAWERFKADANIAGDDMTTYGRPYVYGSGHLDADGARWEAQLRHEAAIAWQIVYEGASNVLSLQPARVLHIDTPPDDAPDGQVVVEVRHRGARDNVYTNTYRAIPSGRRFRLQLDEAAWPRIAGSLGARVTSPGKYKYAYLTQQGYYVVRFDLDFDDWNPGGESVPLRLAKPFAGTLQTGFHFPALDGTEAVIEFRDGDPDKPYIAAFHHNSQAVDHITSDNRWLSRNVIRTQSNNKLRMEDWEGQEGIKLSTDHSGKSQLNLGYLVDSDKQKRGEGFELRTSGYGAIRGGKGLFISADNQPGAGGQQLEMDAAQNLLQQALQATKALSSAAVAAQAIAADYDRQKTLLNDTLSALKQAGILISAPAGIALTSGTDLHLAAAQNLIGTASGQADFSVLKRFTVAAGEAVSIFAQKLGIKLLASKGKVEIQAQSDEMRLRADQNMTVTSVNGRVTIEAKEELLLKCGGSYLRMSSTGIEDGTRGDRTIKSAAFSRQGPTSLSQYLNSLPQTAFSDPYVLRHKITGEVLKKHPYEIVREDGSSIKGITDEMGRTSVQKSHDIESVIIRVLRKAEAKDA